jgi:drug/metabolite transporter (DMT)-like permease
MLIWFWLLRHGEATRASAWFFLNPVIGVFLGAMLLAEPLRAQDFLGAATVAFGIHLVQRG